MPTHQEAALTFVDRSPRRGPAIGMAPLVDIVLLLICFYLFVMQSIQDQEDPRVELPTMVSIAEAEEQPAEVVVNLLPDGSLVVNDQTASPADLAAVLDRSRLARQQAGATLRVVVRADRRQTYGRLDEVLRQIREAGVGQVLFRATEDRP